ncbi:hypothetical protein ZIOFF_044018 [Zingiber officinale]|uniref:Uncharacterized protein n=2 Tax=Zingiber officinale TaxID=94328 RepID=A0A8J5FWG4_ZINOF|nr:hypothetical protein ZIOFF_044018 [Zingiber officinale]
MECVVSLLKRSVSRDVEMAFLAAIDVSRCSEASLIGLGCDECISSSFFEHQLLAMLSPKRLVEKAKKGLPLMRSNSRSSCCDFNNVMVADKGHFVVYSMDDARFVVPLSFLKSCIFQELLKVSADEFGLPGEGPITLACSGVFMEYVISLLKRSVSRDVEMALLASIDNTSRCSDSSLVGLGCDQQRVVV